MDAPHLEEGADGLTLRRRVAFLTTTELEGFVTWDHEVVAPAARRGIEIEFVPWRAAPRWEEFDGVVIRSPWDYQHELDRFLGVLDEIEGRGVPLWNPAPIARWNCDKGYLADLSARGVPVVPSALVRLRDEEHLRRVTVQVVDDARGEGVVGPDDRPRVVVKPRVGASGQDSWALSLDGDADAWHAAAGTLGGRPVLVQPFLPRVTREGELSLIVVDGQPSHVIRKVPAPGEYRSQEEWGGEIRAEQVPDFQAWAMDVVAAIPETRDLLYLRVDALRDHAGRWRLGELELVEPSLYFPFGPASAERFAEALARRLASLSRGGGRPPRAGRSA